VRKLFDRNYLQVKDVLLLRAVVDHCLGLLDAWRAEDREEARLAANFVEDGRQNAVPNQIPSARIEAPRQVRDELSSRYARLRATIDHENHGLNPPLHQA
jgi:hypothetical protein